VSEEVANLIMNYVAFRVNFKSVNGDNIDRVAGRISIEFCKTYSPRKNWDVARKDIKALIISIFRDVMDGRLVFVFEDECDANE
jgi:2,3-bisphosphoglycerate-independent phosphoglycerate mutase